MDKRGRKQLAAAVLAVGILLGSGTAWANSALTHWRGTAPAGAILGGENGEGCPLVVEKEVLTFDISDFPKSYYQTEADYLAYGSCVTAEYTVHNPSDYEVTARMFFPFGTAPDYGDVYNRETEQYSRSFDTAKYGVTVDGIPAESVLRHTFAYYGDEFVLEEDLPKLKYGFDDSGFFRTDLPVTEYIYEISGVDEESYPAASAGFVLDCDSAVTRVILDECSGFDHDEEGRSRPHVWAENGKQLHLYVIGQPLDHRPVWMMYENGGMETEIPGRVSPMESRQLTFREYIAEDWDEEGPVSETDWYNAMVYVLERGTLDSGFIGDLYMSIDELPDCLMRWYEYELTVGPGETVVNTVTAPMYPSIDEDYTPPVYEYEYLLSPAKNWAGFGMLEIIVNTPFYMLESEPGGFERRADGYYVKLDGLPDQELTFTLSESADPKAPARVKYDWFYRNGIGIIAAGAAVAAVVIGVLLRWRKKHTKN